MSSVIWNGIQQSIPQVLLIFHGRCVHFRTGLDETILTIPEHSLHGVALYLSHDLL